MIDTIDTMNHALSGEGNTLTAGCEAQQDQAAVQCNLGLANNQNLMAQVASLRNLKDAFLRVKRNKGAQGVDQISIDTFATNLNERLNEMRTALLKQWYKPMAVRGVDIPKADGKTRKLGIPTVQDRIVQQAIVQVLTPIIDPTFSNSSYGFRPKRSATGAIKQAKVYVEDGRKFVVDIDLEAFFDNVNHDIMMDRCAKHIQDKQLLKLIRKFLQAGMMQDGITQAREQGTPQGGPLSPLLSNILLDDLDKELEKRGHTFCRYADDCNIYVQSYKAGKRVMNSITQFLQKRLKLKINMSKSAVDTVKHRKFLGFRIQNWGALSIAPTSLKRIKDTIRRCTKRNRSVSLERVIKDLNRALLGWFHYFKWAKASSLFISLDAWIRRRLRCFRLKQRKRKYATMTFLRKQGVCQQQCWRLATSDKGWWRKSLNPVAHQAMDKAFFERLGLISLTALYVTHLTETAVCDIARTVV